MSKKLDALLAVLNDLNGTPTGVHNIGSYTLDAHNDPTRYSLNIISNENGGEIEVHKAQYLTLKEICLFISGMIYELSSHKI